MLASSFFRSKVILLLAVVVFALPQVTQAQGVAAKSKPQPKVTAGNSDGYTLMTYDVSDLVLNVPDYPYSGSGNFGHYFMPSGGGMGGGMGGMGGGMFNVQDQGADREGFGSRNHILAQAFGGGGMASRGSDTHSSKTASNSARITMEELVDVIQNIVAPESWSDVGGNGNLAPLGNSLVVRQTPDVHRLIHDMLQQLRAGASKKKTVSIDARWLLLNTDDLDRLISTNEDGCPRVDRQMLAEYTRRPSSIRAITNCFTGQLVYLVSGTQRNVISGYIPVVGSVDRPEDRAMHLASMGGSPLITNAQSNGLNQGPGVRSSAVGYQPLTEKTNLGTLLEIRATLIPDDNRAVVDLRSTITMPGAWGMDAAEFAGQIAQQQLAPTVDRVATEKQELATTLSLPLGQPVLAGGITFSSKSGASTGNKSRNSRELQPGKAPNKTASHQDTASAEDPQLYLILELR